jgi:hypothetical protein
VVFKNSNNETGRDLLDGCHRKGAAFK